VALAGTGLALLIGAAVGLTQSSSPAPRSSVLTPASLPGRGTAEPTPAVTVTPLFGVTVVRRGEGLWDVARRVLGDGSRWELLAQLNGLEEPYHLAEGQKLLVPPRGGS
jgi:nucleoid-associated protein YgaU